MSNVVVNRPRIMHMLQKFILISTYSANNLFHMAYCRRVSHEIDVIG